MKGDYMVMINAGVFVKPADGAVTIVLVYELLVLRYAAYQARGSTEGSGLGVACVVLGHRKREIASERERQQLLR